MTRQSQALNVLTVICVFIGLLVVIQLWLLSASLEAVLGGDGGTALAGAAVSAALLAANVGLLLFAFRLSRTTGTSAGERSREPSR